MAELKSVTIGASFQVSKSHCPTCDSVLDTATEIRANEKTRKDLPKSFFSVCARCGEILYYDKADGYRLVTKEEVEFMRTNESQWKLLLLMAQYSRSSDNPLRKKHNVTIKGKIWE